MAGRRSNLLRPNVNVTPKSDAHIALNGARYHLQSLKAEIAAGLVSNNSVARFHWHLRGFFWELVAMRDALRRSKDTAVKAVEDSITNSRWYAEIDAYRNGACGLRCGE
jgi:hypothetical protein